jgi:hypothetical protein
MTIPRLTRRTLKESDASAAPGQRILASAVSAVPSSIV